MTAQTMPRAARRCSRTTVLRDEADGPDRVRALLSVQSDC